LITANEKHLVIAGRDRWNPQQLTVPGKDGKPVPKQQEAGTANAVYTFLQEQLGVRWLWPGELGIDVVRSDTIEVKPFEFRYYPQIRGRGGVFHFSSQLNTRGYGHSHEWTRMQRLQLDSLDMSGGHGFADWWERYHKTHPEIFALQPDGTRSGFPNPRTVKLCMSNPLVGELWLKDVQQQLSEDPTQTVFNASPNDGWSSGHCVCEDCSAWDHPDGEPRLFHWKNHREQRPALSDRDVTFANKMGELLKAKYPDKDYRVLMMSYGHSRPAPVKARPADNVIMSIVANFFGRTGWWIAARRAETLIGSSSKPGQRSFPRCCGGPTPAAPPAGNRACRICTSPRRRKTCRMSPRRIAGGSTSTASGSIGPRRDHNII
jgi:hypothetical protein